MAPDVPVMVMVYVPLTFVSGKPPPPQAIVPPATSASSRPNAAVRNRCACCQPARCEYAAAGSIASASVSSAANHSGMDGGAPRGSDSGGALARNGTAIVNVLEAPAVPGVTDPGLNPPVAPLGKPVAASVTALAKLPLLGITLIVNVADCPAKTVCDCAALATVKPEPVAAFTVVVALAELFAGVGSVTALVTLTDAFTVPLAVVVTITVAVTVATLAIVPMVQVIVPAASVHVPCVAVPETNVTFAGTGTVAVTPVAGDGPAFVTVTV